MTNVVARTYEKITGYTGTLSGAASVLGSWQVCHTICLGIIALLGMIGITVVGMPLAFLTKFAFPFWTIAIMLLVALALLSLKKQCVSRTLLLFNFGLIVAGTPLPEKPSAVYGPWFWAIGGIMAGIAVMIFVKNKLKKNTCKEGSHMKNILSIVITVLIILLAGYSIISLASSPLAFGNSVLPTSNPRIEGGAPATSAVSATSLFDTITTGTTGDGDVELALTPQEFKGGVLNIALGANTHSVDLSQFDLGNAILLVYQDNKQKEKTIKPGSAPALSGHHANGMLAFQLDQDKLESFTVVILGIPKQQQRVYQWTA